MTNVPPWSEYVDQGLRLRLPTAEDAPWVTASCQDPDIQRFTRVPSPYTEVDGRDFVRFASDAWASGGGAHLVVVDDDGRRLGAVGMDIDRPDLAAEVGYWIAQKARGRGVATRATRLLCRLAFESFGVGRIGLTAAVTNPGSNAVARRLGFTHEGTLRLAMVDGPSGDPAAPRCDALIWGLLPGELR